MNQIKLSNIMKNWPYLFVISALLLLFSCDNSAEKARIAQAKQDSIRQARAAERIQARADSLAQVMEAKRLEAEVAMQQQLEENERQKQYAGPDSGTAYLQVEAWRSEQLAENRVNVWKERGFTNAYVLKTGSEITGDVWFRIRLLKDNPETVYEAAKKVEEEYGTATWIID
jgi:hypothetical protein